ncbi:unnamed protein product [Nippostrongylus brasiliensis]|uniref:DDE_3 domain-containing protein n=1 Tax=Nippostrongylus brasiliensis TaxID=27835 RepID=A0A0N4YNS9_NIPBR|nr:unnamed protein product [Nippostrongylus brasiliensis]
MRRKYMALLGLAIFGMVAIGTFTSNIVELDEEPQLQLVTEETPTDSLSILLVGDTGGAIVRDDECKMFAHCNGEVAHRGSAGFGNPYKTLHLEADNLKHSETIGGNWDNGRQTKIWSAKDRYCFEGCQKDQREGITSDGKTPLVFVESEVKINSQSYLKSILKKEQDSAPAHKAKAIQQWCASNFQDFISALQWPSHSPDLNPMDYAIWSILKSKACATYHKDIATLLRALEKAWEEIDEEVLRAAVEAFPERLKACIRAKGGHFEI